MNSPGKIKLKKKSNKFASTVMYVLILLLSVSTIITIQLRSNKRQHQNTEQSAQTSAVTVAQPEVADSIAETDISINDILDAPDTHQETNTETNTETIKDIKPVYVMPVSGEIEKVYSETELVYSATMDDWRQHLGCDIICDDGEEVASMADGTVTNIYSDPEFGCTVVVTHKDGVVIKYANLSLSGDISVDSNISAGQIIGTVDANPPCETSDKLHIHIEAAKNDIRIDPLSLI